MVPIQIKVHVRAEFGPMYLVLSFKIHLSIVTLKKQTDNNYCGTTNLLQLVCVPFAGLVM